MRECCCVSWEVFFKKGHGPIPNVAGEGGLRDVTPYWRLVAAPLQWAHTDPIFMSIRRQMSNVCISRFIQTSVILSGMTGGDLRPDICLLQCTERHQLSLRIWGPPEQTWNYEDRCLGLNRWKPLAENKGHIMVEKRWPLFQLSSPTISMENTWGSFVQHNIHRSKLLKL